MYDVMTYQFETNRPNITKIYK